MLVKHIYGIPYFERIAQAEVLILATLYESISILCNERNITVYGLCKNIGISPSILTDLKAGRTKTLSIETSIKIASYFGVSVDSLVGKDNEENEPTISSKKNRDIAKDLENLMTALDNDSNLMFYGEPITEGAKELLRTTMKLGLEATSLKNKDQYIPKKYRRQWELE